MKHDAFISYRRGRGYPVAKLIRDQLELRNIHCYLDLEEDKAGKFNEHLLDAIYSSPYFILIETKNFLNRCKNEEDWVRKEIIAAIENNKTIIPVRFPDFEWPKKLSEEFPDKIKQLEFNQGVLFSEEYLEATINKIISYMSDIKVSKNELPIKDTIIFGATTHTTVVDSIIEGWESKQIFRNHGFLEQNRTYQWSDKILKDLDSGEIDMAIYNKQSCLKYNQSHNNKIHIIRDVCSSMGGRNFYILASRKGKWTDMSLEQFKQSLNSDTVIGVSKSSDMFYNLLYILDMTEEDLLQCGVRLLNYNSAQGLSLFDVFPDILIIAGQDIRFLAKRKRDCFEIINYEDFPEEKRDFFYKNSINSLLIGPSGMKKLSSLDLEDLGVELMLSFYKNIMNKNVRDKVCKKLVWPLRDICDDEDDLDYIIRNIIFETYRIV